MKMPGEFNYRIGFNTDNRKKFEFSLFTGINGASQSSSLSFNSNVTFSLKPTNYLRVSLSPGYNRSFDELQYVTKQTYGTEDRYIFGSINQTTISASVRVNVNLSPDLTIQYWGQPFVATGTYKDYKYITDPMAASYHDRFHVYSPDQYRLGTLTDTMRWMKIPTAALIMTSGNPILTFRSSFLTWLLRWEYNPGSSVYLVWSQTRNGLPDIGTMDLVNDIGNLFDAQQNQAS